MELVDHVDDEVNVPVSKRATVMELIDGSRIELPLKVSVAEVIVALDGIGERSKPNNVLFASV